MVGISRQERRTKSDRKLRDIVDIKIGTEPNRQYFDKEKPKNVNLSQEGGKASR